jgi:phosphoglycerate dehydrogenase-like enzyme
MSRWGRSAYDTDADWAAEAERLAPLVEVVSPGRDADVIVVNSKTRVDAALLDRVPRARLVVTSTSGYEHLDLGAIAGHGAAACRLPLARRDAVVEASLELALTGLRQTRALLEDARDGRWSRGRLPALPIRTLRGARVGLLGLGVIGRAMAGTLRALGADLWGLDPAGLPADVPAAGSLAQLLAGSDVVSVHAASSPTSRRMLSAAALRHGHPGLVLVNTARGDILDVDAAFEALQAGRLGFLGVDVFPAEPWPRLAEQVADPRVVFTPHSAGWHAGLPLAVQDGLEAVLAAWVEGRPLPHRLA